MWERQEVQEVLSGKLMDETKTIKLIIPGEPVAQQRHRSVIMPRKGARAIEALNKKTGIIEKLYRKEDLFIHNYDPSYKDKQEKRRWICGLAPDSLLRGPLRVDRYYYFSYLAGHYGTGKNAGTVKVSAPVWKETQPDIDNYDKFLFDILQDLYFRNDGQIAAGVQGRFYSEHPRTEVYISKLTIESDIKELEHGLQVQADRQLAARKKQKTAELAFSDYLPTNA